MRGDGMRGRSEESGAGMGEGTGNRVPVRGGECGYGEADAGKERRVRAVGTGARVRWVMVECCGISPREAVTADTFIWPRDSLVMQAFIFLQGKILGKFILPPAREIDVELDWENKRKWSARVDRYNLIEHLTGTGATE